jgi:hypothetical protein
VQGGHTGIAPPIQKGEKREKQILFIFWNKFIICILYTDVPVYLRSPQSLIERIWTDALTLYI